MEFDKIMKPEDMKDCLWAIYRSLPQEITKDDFQIILELVQEIEYFITHEMDYKPAVYKVRSGTFEF